MMTNYDGVMTPLATALEERGYTDLTPVQTAMLTPELNGRDALVSAQTGSGKTVAFGLAMAPTLLEAQDRFAPAEVPVALIIAPTRELALQVKSEIDWLYAKTGASVVSCVGGMDIRTERRNLDRGAHIVVGTPGRLRDHIERGAFDTSGLKCVVLDEADEMLDMGFREDLEYILDTSPKTRRTLLFSATVSRPIASMAKRYQQDAMRISTAAEEKQHQDIEYKALTVAPNDRQNAIINILRFYDAKNAIVFCGTRANVNQLTSRLNNRGFSVVALSGELSQNERSHALQAMRDGRAQVCVATDVAARGIDLPNLELVIHADLPRGSEPLLHRSGRTGRAGRKGVSALIVPYNWRRKTERLLGNAKVTATWEKPPSLEDVIAKDRERFMNDACLTEPVKEDEQEIVKELLEKHSADQIAAALVRIHHTSKPAAEELLDQAAPDRERTRKERQDFTNGVWFELSVGRKHTAEPRWLLPMLCRAGHITKNEIGSIKIQEEKTFVELEAKCVDAFLEALGPSRKMEKTVDVQKLDKKPVFKEAGGRPRRSERPDRPARADRGPRPERGEKSERRGPRREFDKKPVQNRDAGKEYHRKSDAGDDAQKKEYRKPEAAFDRPKKKYDRDTEGKKPFKKNDQRDGAKGRDNRSRDKSGMTDRNAKPSSGADFAYNKRFGKPEDPSERFKKTDKTVNADAPKRASKKDTAKRSKASDTDQDFGKFNRKPKDKKLSLKKKPSADGGKKDGGFRALKRNKKNASD
ncbi:MAG: ATP-dependent RNA helicase DeaD [Sneathiella sp.]|jgi:ATP-dependent RNA helicase DeaD